MTGALLLRADASPAVGAGHLARAIALADAWRRRGGTAHIAVGPDAGAVTALAEARGIPVVAIDAAVGSADDAAATAARAMALRAGACVIDGYRFDADYCDAIRRAGLGVAVIDDFGRGDRPADVTIDPNYGATGADLAGPRYALLRGEFFAHVGGPRRARGRRGRRRPLRVLIAFGGSDPTRSAARVLRLLPPAPAVIATVLVGPGYADDGELDAAAACATASGHVVELARAPRDVAWLMATADAAICAAGTVLWELAYFGVPTAAFVIAGNQHEVAAALARDRYVLGGTWLLDAPAGDVAAAIAALTGNAAVRRRLARRFSELVDGRGADRVADALAKLVAARTEAAA
ncbi:MAG: hypothetical protein D6689_12935 [Deltaproteobacteria bacterium]|nr:MAG: hypothetical protein D6689_12935 [Deltaproteobacteria bacterium]